VLFSNNSNTKDILLFNTLSLFCLYNTTLALYKEGGEAKLLIDFSKSYPFDNFSLTTLKELKAKRYKYEKGNSITSIVAF